MKVFKKIGGGVGFARKEAYEYDGVKYEADLKNGDIVTILDAGTTEAGKWGEQENFKIKTRNGDKKISLNQMSTNVLIDEFGDETENWVDKNVIVILKKDIIAGEKRIIAFLVTEGWGLDEYGELVKDTPTHTPLIDPITGNDLGGESLF
mgnify:CR=1 FL=1